MRIEFLAPSHAGVREEDVDMIRVLRDLRDQAFDFTDFGAVGGDGDRNGVGVFVREGVQRIAGFLTRGGFAGGYEYFGAACLEEARVGGVSMNT